MQMRTQNHHLCAPNPCVFVIPMAQSTPPQDRGPGLLWDSRSNGYVAVWPLLTRAGGLWGCPGAASEGCWHGAAAED